MTISSHKKLIGILILLFLGIVYYGCTSLDPEPQEDDEAVAASHDAEENEDTDSDESEHEEGDAKQEKKAEASAVETTPVVTSPESKKAEPQLVQESVQVVSGDFGHYVVLEGESLSQIALKTMGKISLWKELMSANREVIKNANLIYPGDVIKIPLITEEAKKFHTEYQGLIAQDEKNQEKTITIGKGESLSSIAYRELGCIRCWRHIWLQNRDAVKDPNRLKEGTEIRFRNLWHFSERAYYQTKKESDKGVKEKMDAPKAEIHEEKSP